MVRETGHVIPKTFKMVLNTSLLNTEQYKVCIKGKVEQSWERSCGVVAIEKGAFWSPSTTVIIFTLLQVDLSKMFLSNIKNYKVWRFLWYVTNFMFSIFIFFISVSSCLYAHTNIYIYIYITYIYIYIYKYVRQGKMKWIRQICWKINGRKNLFCVDENLFFFFADMCFDLNNFAFSGQICLLHHRILVWTIFSN